MFSSTASRTLLFKTIAKNSSINTAVTASKTTSNSLRCLSSLTPTPPSSSNNKHDDAQQQRRLSTAAEPAVAPPAEEETTTAAAVPAGGLLKRFQVTAEVTVSKIFPAGFGWQTASVVAENNFGFAPDSLNFALTTGMGDALGVLGGHCLFYGAKKTLVDSSINMESEFQTGVLLGTAAFCSGTAWQPIVDALQGANLSFMGVFTGTWVGCGMAFYAGLRAGRTILSGYLSHIGEPTYENSKADASLSVVIGGATGFFVGTDAAYLPDQNFLLPVVGIQDGTPDLVGCAIAGSSTSLGFLTAQSAFNVIYPAGKCWND
mmetsp:Transcript_22646/g.53584  ORF Transcript_22646/g.53584 Transcript_22646/m.53584 type:complete len:318 (+) Transcript_22646:2553-3506(+)|eukprot:CAMPEP_0113499966 /NCGR_PEP_ID=MMETSP0014_2-20120614/32044_1 /TAXON_ID=2857 /ORGANISM="Nitzschia sp." /LENGTH=317 /DNA_ID=CAMNT_0000394205 /DNA_START=2369 /DNA_END=3322 /DNA_ORIENTATION=- /assembly_acc=CAM_ASM_000159